MVNGRVVSQAELDAVLSMAEPEVRPVVAGNPEELLRYYGFIERLAEIAEKQKLADESPLKEQLLVARKKALAQALSNQYVTDHPATPEELKQYYDAHVADFTVANVKALCVPIANEADREGAKAKAEGLVRQVRNGGDFGALAAKYPMPAGFSNTIRKSDQAIPDIIRTLVFQLKPGEVTAPITLPSGVFLLRLEKVQVKPFDEVRAEVSTLAVNQAFLKWVESVRKTVDVKGGSN
jgi:parvulin-like peptidyl-prolyl isomerase